MIISMIYIIGDIYRIMMNRINDSIEELWRSYNFCQK